jgi:formylglycine-generating enzyme required for sulfatase activity
MSQNSLPRGSLLVYLSLGVFAASLPLLGQEPRPVGDKEEWPKEFENSIGMRLVRIPKGKFLMGSTKEEIDAIVSEDNTALREVRAILEGELPRHEVEITRDFWMGAFEVTQKQYQDVMKTNPSYFRPGGKGEGQVKGLDTGEFPVEQVSWKDAKKFCAELTNLAEEKQARRYYRLPTEAEWEYACRAGTTTVFHFGNSLSLKQANCSGRFPVVEGEKDESLHRTTKVGSYEKNAWGLFDMHGNVQEWCEDWSDRNYYKDAKARVDPKGPATGTRHIMRGGSWSYDGSYARAALRNGVSSFITLSDQGFRVVCVPADRSP